MWSRIGFGALCLATILDAVWIFSLVREETAADAGRVNAPVSSATPADTQPINPSPSTESGEPPAGVPAKAVLVEVLRHTDGDTLHVIPVITSGALVAGVDTTVRLLEIDTPESVDPSKPVQCYAKEASGHLKKLLPVGTQAWVTEDIEALDRYGRTLLYVWGADGTLVNLEMVKAGMAYAVLFEPNDAYIDEMRSAEKRARADSRGLWGACKQRRPLGLVGTQPDPQHPATSGTDPRFAYCYEANAAGYGNYRRRVDAEYAWYDDVDRDGVVCEF